MTLTLKPEIPEIYLLPDLSPLDDVTGILLEVLAINGTNSTNLDVDILGCVKGQSHFCPFSRIIRHERRKQFRVIGTSLTG